MTICCSFVPANWPRIACVIEDGGCMVREYINIDEVVAMMSGSEPEGCHDRREPQIAKADVARILTPYLGTCSSIWSALTC